MVGTAEAERVCWEASRRLVPELEFGIAANGTYPRQQFERLLGRIALDNEFANAGAKAYQLARGEDVAVDTDARNPLARALLYHLRGLAPDAVDAQFTRIHEALLKAAARDRVFTRPVDVAVDVHDWLYYGDADTPHVSATNPEQGTDRAYKFATLCVVDPSVRFTLAWVPLDGDDTEALQAALQHLIGEAPEYVDINRVYCDRGFYRVHLVKTLQELDVEFVMRASKTRKIQRIIADYDSDTVVTDYETIRKNPPTGRATVRLVVVPHRTREDDHLCLITNREATVELARPLAEAYRRRWGIETSYRKVGEFLPKTTSRTFSVRLFYFLLAVALYNCWVLVNLRVGTDGPSSGEAVVPTAVFRQFLGLRSFG
jgi:hypothetical protein